MRTSRKTEFRKLKITLVTMTYHSQRPQCPSVSPHVLLVYIVHSDRKDPWRDSNKSNSDTVLYFMYRELSQNQEARPIINIIVNTTVRLLFTKLVNI